MNINKALKRIKSRKKSKNRYDKFKKSFYQKVQKSFLNIAKKNRKRCYVIDNSKDSTEVEKIVLSKFLKVINYERSK